MSFRESEFTILNNTFEAALTDTNSSEYLDLRIVVVSAVRTLYNSKTCLFYLYRMWFNSERVFLFSWKLCAIGLQALHPTMRHVKFYKWGSLKEVFLSTTFSHSSSTQQLTLLWWVPAPVTAPADVINLLKCVHTYVAGGKHLQRHLRQLVGCH